MALIAKTRTKSAWTPLTNEQTNQKMYEERRSLANKWFEKWTDAQRRQILDDFLHQSKVRQLHHARSIIDDIAPEIHHDFTRYLPRFLSLYIFSYLDPRSLCRCSRVCWYWSWLSSMDELWIRKCLLLGWYLPSPRDALSPKDPWKSLYIDNIKLLQALRPKMQDKPKLDLDRLSLQSGVSGKGTPKSRGNKPPPWRGSDPIPKDTLRNNYLDNAENFLTSVNNLRRRGYYSNEIREMTRNAKNKVNTGLTNKQRANSTPIHEMTRNAKNKVNTGLTNKQRANSTPKLNETMTSPKSKPKDTKPWTPTRPKSVANGYLSSHGEPKRPASAKSESQGGLKKGLIEDDYVNPLFDKQPWRVLGPEDED